MTESNSEQQPQQLQRLSFWPNLSASFKHIRQAVREEGNRIRKSDPITIWLVPAVSIVLCFVSFMGGWLRLLVAFACYLSILTYVLTRIGIVRSMNLRQTNMVWHLLMACFLGGIVFAFVVLDLTHLSGK